MGVKCFNRNQAQEACFRYWVFGIGYEGAAGFWRLAFSFIF